MDVFLVDAVRTPVAGRNGAFSDVHAVDLAAVPLTELERRTRVPSSEIDQFLMACATPIGEQGMNFARAASLAAGWNEDVSSTTIDAGASSGLRAFNQGWSAIASGSASVVVVGGAASMTRVPAGATAGVAVGKPFGANVYARYEEVEGLATPGLLAERLAADAKLTRSDLDAYALHSTERCLAASHMPWWSRSIAPVTVPFRSKAKPEAIINTDALLEPGAPLFAPHDFMPSFVVEGLITAGNFAGPADGAAAVMLAGESAVKRLGLAPLARIRAVVSVGASPVVGNSGAAALHLCAQRAGVKVQDLSAVSVHEDSAATPLALSSVLNPEVEVNTHGGVLTLGDPIGVGSLITLLIAVHSLPAGSTTAVVAAGSLGQADALLLQQP